MHLVLLGQFGERLVAANRLQGDLDGFVYRGGTLSAIKVAGANTYPRDINNVGQIVGTFEDRNGRHGFLYESGTFTRFDVPGSVETEVYGVNDPGVIVGVSVSIPAIPEPGLLVFVCFGLFGIGLAWKRKSSRIR